MMDQGKYSKDIRELIATRIDSQLPDNLKLFVGDNGSLSKAEMIHHVYAGDAIGNSIIESQMSFLKALSSGKFITAINSV